MACNQYWVTDYQLTRTRILPIRVSVPASNEQACPMFTCCRDAYRVAETEVGRHHVWAWVNLPGRTKGDGRAKTKTTTVRCKHNSYRFPRPCESLFTWPANTEEYIPDRGNSTSKERIGWECPNASSGWNLGDTGAGMGSDKPDVLVSLLLLWF